MYQPPQKKHNRIGPFPAYEVDAHQWIHPHQWCQSAHNDCGFQCVASLGVVLGIYSNQQFWGIVYTVMVFPMLNFNIKGIYPDLLHIIDLALLVDVYASAFLCWTDTSNIFEGSRDERLIKLYRHYLEWCIENRVLPMFGMFLTNVFLLVTSGCFKLKILFCSQSLQKKASAYPNIGQKRLNGAASRMMVHWAYIIASQIHNDHPSDIHRLWGAKMLPNNCCTWELPYIYICMYVCIYIYIYMYIFIYVYLYIFVNI